MKASIAAASTPSHDAAENPTVARTNPRKCDDGPADALKRPAFSTTRRGTGRAPSKTIVNSLRVRLSAMALVSAMLVTGAAPLFASEPAQPCATHHHDCNTAAQLKGCCCIEQGDRSNEATPAGGKTQVAQPVADSTVVVTSAALALPGLLRHARALTTCPRSSPPDLVTLFGTFLI